MTLCNNNREINYKIKQQEREQKLKDGIHLHAFQCKKMYLFFSS